MVTQGAARRGLPFVVAAPSGTGKTTVCRLALERDSNLRFSVSHTTRAPREGEQNGVDYHFVSLEEFNDLISRQRFVEYAEFNGSFYGTSWEALEEPLAAGQDLLVEIEVQGAGQLRERRPDACFVFLLPPTMAALGDRLRGRATDSEETIQRRLAIAEIELAAIAFFDYAVVNDDLEEAVEAVLEIVHAERNGDADAVRERHGREEAFKRWQRRDDGVTGGAAG